MKRTILGLLGIGFLASSALHANACSRAVYLGPNNMIITGRTMDWSEDLRTNLHLFPRGIERRGAKSDNTIFWTSKYGSIGTAGYDIGISDGMNEAGLVVNLLFLPETVYSRPNDTRPIMGLSIWAQYVLDNFATVAEAVVELSKERFRIDAPDLPGGKKSLLHMAISDATGDSAILEYLNGKLTIHHGRKFQVLTNSPTYDNQLAINNYWQSIGGLAALPGTNRSSDRFARASFYINAVEQSSDPKTAVPTVLSVMRNVSVPFGISMPDQPHLSSTRWRSVCDQKNKVYYFEPTLAMQTFWVNLQKVDFSKGRPEQILQLANGEIYSGDATSKFQPSPRPFVFLLEA